MSEEDEVTKKCDSTLAKWASIATILGLVVTVIVVPMEFLVWNKSEKYPSDPDDNEVVSNPIPTLTPLLRHTIQPTTAPEDQPSHFPTNTPSNDPTDASTPSLTGLDWCPSGITSISRSDNYNVQSEDDRDDALIGSLDNVDKIIRIEVFRAKYIWYGMDYVVAKIRVTYRLKDGREVALTRGKHSNRTPFETLEIPEGVYLTSADVMTNHDINVIDWVSFCLSDNSCYGPWGGPRKNNLEVLGHDNGVIKCFFGDVGADWVSTLGCYYEICSEEE